MSVLWLALALLSEDPGTVKGTARFDGAPVRWAFVYVKKASVSLVRANAGRPVVLSLGRDGYHPRVLGVQTDQFVEVDYRDERLHSPHWIPRRNREN